MEMYLVGVDTTNSADHSLHVGIFEDGQIKSNLDVLTTKPVWSGFVSIASIKQAIKEAESSI